MAFRSDLDALILGVLHRERMHGYEISRRINDGALGAVQVKEGQLYPILHRLENEGAIEAEVAAAGRQARAESLPSYRAREAGTGSETRRLEIVREGCLFVDECTAGGVSCLTLLRGK